MEAQVFDYWRSRLEEGAIFASFADRQEGYDYRRSAVDQSALWPNRVAKDSLYDDYVNWVSRTKYVRPGTKSEFYRVLQPFLYVYGNKKHTTRHDVNKRMVAGDRIVSGRVQRYFIRVPPVDVCRAHARLVSGRGTVSQMEFDRQLISRYARVFDLTPEEIVQQEENMSSAQVPQT